MLQSSGSAQLAGEWKHPLAVPQKFDTTGIIIKRTPQERGQEAWVLFGGERWGRVGEEKGLDGSGFKKSCNL